MPEPSIIRSRRCRLGIFVVAALLVPVAADAHTALKGMGSFWSGVAHLLTSLDQVGFLLGLAIWAGFADRRGDARVIAAAFIAVFVGALVAGIADWQFDLSAEIAALMIVVGLAGAAQLRVGSLPLVGMALAGGLIGGVTSDDGTAVTSLGLFSLGGSIAAAATVSYGLIVTRGVVVGWAPIAWRAGASWIAAIGLMSFALAGSRYFGYR